MTVNSIKSFETLQRFSYLALIFLAENPSIVLYLLRIWQ